MWRRPGSVFGQCLWGRHPGQAWSPARTPSRSSGPPVRVPPLLRLSPAARVPSLLIPLLYLPTRHCSPPLNLSPRVRKFQNLRGLPAQSPIVQMVHMRPSQGQGGSRPHSSGGAETFLPGDAEEQGSFCCREGISLGGWEVGFPGGPAGWDEAVTRGFKGLLGEAKVIWELEVKASMSRKEIAALATHRPRSVTVCWEIARLGHPIPLASETDLLGQRHHSPAAQAPSVRVLPPPPPPLSPLSCTSGWVGRFPLLSCQEQIRIPWLSWPQVLHTCRKMGGWMGLGAAFPSQAETRPQGDALPALP